MEIEGLSFPEAVEFLAKRANIPLPAEDEARSNADRLRRRVLELNRAAARWYYDQLQLPQGAAVQAYLDKRQIRKSIAVRFGMGASPDRWDGLLTAMTRRGYTKEELLAAGLVVNGRNGRLYDKFRNRLMLPVIDTRGDVVGFGSRVIDKTSFSVPSVVAKKNSRGRMTVNGMVYGHINGTVRGMIHATVEGDVDLTMLSGAEGEEVPDDEEED